MESQGHWLINIFPPARRKPKTLEHLQNTKAIWDEMAQSQHWLLRLNVNVPVAVDRDGDDEHHGHNDSRDDDVERQVVLRLVLDRTNHPLPFPELDLWVNREKGGRVRGRFILVKRERSRWEMDLRERWLDSSTEFDDLESSSFHVGILH